MNRTTAARRLACQVGIIVIGMTLAACQSHPTLSPPTATPTPEVIIVSPTVSETEEATPLPTAIPMPITAADMPVGYIPHPALQRIAPPNDGGWWAYSPHWEDDNRFKYRVDPRWGNKTGCFTQNWAVYTLSTHTTEVISETSCFTETAKETPDAAAHVEFEAGTIEEQELSPDGSRLFVLTQVPSEPSLPKIGDYEPQSEATIHQGWFIDLNSGKVQPAFYTLEIFSYLWSPDSLHLIVVADICYGGDWDSGLGLYSIDAQTLSVYTLDPQYRTGCEGSIGYRISPDSQHILHDEVLSSMDGKQVHICDENEYARDYTWSSDGRYAYVACDQGTDTLRRYDTWSRENRIIVDRQEVNFQAIYMMLSPDQTHLAFVWATNSYTADIAYNGGIWVLDLTQFADE